MADFLPFLAVSPGPTIADRVITKPFDRYSDHDKAEELKGNPFSFLHIILAQSHANESRRQAFDRFLENGILTKSSSPVYAVYRQIQEQGCFTGFVGVMPVGSEAKYNQIKRHEATLVRKEALLAEYLDETNLNAEPALLTFDSTAESQTLLEQLTQAPPDIHVELPGFGKHQVWWIQEPSQQQRIKLIFDPLPGVYIADGHHRISSSRRLAIQRFQQHQNPDAADQFVLVACFPSTEARIFPYHRMVKSAPTDFLSRLKDQLSATVKIELGDYQEPTHNRWMMHYAGQWYRFYIDAPLPQHVLPAEWLNEHVLSPILNIHDLTSDKNIGFVGGCLSVEQLIHTLQSAKYELLFALPPVEFKQFFFIVDPAQAVVPKSTWFEPKLPSALTMYDMA
ncbi:MAG: DUF1015 family protein [Bacteroidetes bacterium]|nr:DUF1015 family protein [Bacteroidota bacterium]